MCRCMERPASLNVCRHDWPGWIDPESPKDGAVAVCGGNRHFSIPDCNLQIEPAKRHLPELIFGATLRCFRAFPVLLDEAKNANGALIERDLVEMRWH
jgi:hypothetical protein